MPYDYKKEFREFYLPPSRPEAVDVPAMRFVAVRGEGDPNEEGGAYKRALEVLYALCYTIKMSRRGDHRIEGYFDYVVPPLEGLWRQEGEGEFDPARKDALHWISMIRLPEFVTEAEFAWAKAEVARKKGLDASGAEYFLYNEGLCVQCMHIGPYDAEPETLERMRAFIRESGLRLETGGGRLHHEIYLSDPRRCAPEKLRVVLRVPVSRAGEEP